MVPVTAQTRTELRRLKRDFDLAFARLRRDAEADDPDYRAAREAYGLWRVAIDQYGEPLLDMLDAAEAQGSLATAAARVRGSPVEPLTVEQQADLRATFQDIDRMGEMMRLIDDA